MDCCVFATHNISQCHSVSGEIICTEPKFLFRLWEKAITEVGASTQACHQRLFFKGVVVNRDKSITDINYTCDHQKSLTHVNSLSTVFWTLVINIYLWISPWILKKIWNSPNRILWGHWFMKKTWSQKSCIRFPWSHLPPIPSPRSCSLSFPVGCSNCE